MAYKPSQQWVKDGAPDVIKSEIDDNGTWELYQPNFFSTEAVTFYAAQGSGVDPVGATVQLALRLGTGTPTSVTDAVLTLPSLAAGVDVGFPERIYPQGKVCAVVTGYVAPFKLVGVQ